MFDITSLGEFSRNHCIGICAFLIPANLLTTLTSLILVIVNPSQMKLLISAGIAISFAIILSCHVASWLIVGVIQVPTFILLALSVFCIGLNIWVILRSQQQEPLLSKMVKKAVNVNFS